MAQEMTLVVKATDGTSKVFDVIAKSGDRLGDSLEKAGKEGKKGLDDLGNASTANAKKMNQVDAAATKIGAALGGLVAGLSLAGTAAREQARLQDGVTRAYGDSAQTMLEFANHIQDTTRFSNDAAQASLLLASSLSTNYGLSADSIQQLVSRAADMAQTFGIQLPDAMQRLAAAIRGEGEAAEALGLNMSDAAVQAAALKAGMTGWNTGGVSEAEKAAFRFNLVMQQSEQFAGSAGDAVQGMGGKFVQFKNDAQDGIAAIGQFAGPVAEVAAELGPLALYLPVVGAGLGKLGGAAGIASKSIGLIGLAVNPLTLGIGALVAVGGFLAASWMDQKQKAQEYDASLQTLSDTFETLRRQGDIELAELGESFTDLVNDVDDKAQEMQQSILDSLGGPDAFKGWIDNRIGELIGEGMKPGPAALQAQAEWKELIDGVAIETEKLTLVNEKLADAMADPNINVEAWMSWASGLINAATTAEELEAAINLINETPLSDFSNQVEGNVIAPLTEAIATLEDLRAVTEGWQEQFYNLQFDGEKGAAFAVRDLAKAFEEGTAPVTKITGSLTDASGEMTYFTETVALNTDQLLRARIAYDRVNEALVSGEHNTEAITAEIERLLALGDPVAFSQGMENLAYEIENTEKYALSLTEVMHRMSGTMDATGMSAGAAALKEQQLAEATIALQDATAAYVGEGGNIIDVLMRMSGVFGEVGSESKTAANGLSEFNESLLRASQMNEATQNLESVLRTFEQIEALGARSDSAASIADNLIGAPGELGTLQALWENVEAGTSRATLSYEEYIGALKAGESIQQSNLRTNELLTSIQAKQIPLLAEQTLAYENNIANIEQMDAAQQQYTLALQDTGFQSQLAAQYAIAYQASIGAIPESVATEMILNSAAADPVMDRVLREMGLIEEGADGEIRVNFPDGPTVQEAVADLSLAVEDLTRALLGLPPLNLDVNDGPALAKMDEIRDKLGSLNDDPPMLGVYAEDNVSPTVAAIKRGIESETIVIPVSIGTALGSGAADAVLNSASAALANIDIEVTLQDNASEKIDEVAALLNNTDGDSATMELDLDDEATGKVDSADRRHRSVDGNLSVMKVDLRDEASNKIDAVDRRHGNLDGNISTVKVNANTSNADSAISRIRNLDGDTLATSYYKVVTVYSSVGGGGGSGAFQQLGGVPHYAGGGVVAEFGEVGPELLSFPDGGSALIASRMTAEVPVGTYVSPHNAVGQFSGTPEIHIHLEGPVFGMSDLSARVANEIAPEIRDVFQEWYRSQGVFGIND